MGLLDGLMGRNGGGKDRVSDLLAKFSKASQARNWYESAWVDYLKYYMGDQWDDSKTGDMTADVYNMIYSHVETIIPILTDQRPIFQANGVNDPDMELEEDLNFIFKDLMLRSDFDSKLPGLLRLGAIYGTSFIYPYWDKEAQGGLGNVAFKTIPPWYIFPDPSARSVDGAARMFYADFMPVDMARAMFPDHAKEIKPGMPTALPKLFSYRQILDEGWQVATNQNRTSDSKGAFRGEEEVLIIEAWEKDYTFTGEKDKEEEAKAHDEDARLMSGESVMLDPRDLHGQHIEVHEAELAKLERHLSKAVNVEEQEVLQQFVLALSQHNVMHHEFRNALGKPRKYPNWRVTVLAGDVEVSDGPSLTRTFPMRPYQNISVEDRFWGMSDIKQLQDPQDNINRSISQISEILKLTGNPPLVTDSNSGLDVDNLYNESGQIIVKNPGSELYWLQTGNLPAGVFEHVSNLKFTFDTISGSHDVMQGRRPAGVEAGVAIAALQEAAQGRLRLKQRSLGQTIVEVGRVVLELVQEYYTLPRILRFFEGDERIEIPLDMERLRKIQASDFDVRLVSDSALPTNKTARVTLAMQLFQNQIIDRRAVLEVVDFPGKAEVIKRMEGGVGAEQQQVINQMSSQGASQEEIQAALQAQPQSGMPA